MRKLLVAVVVGVIALGAAPSATAQTTTVPISLCAIAPYHVPTGSEVIVEAGWSDTTRKLVTRFLEVQQTDVVFNGVAVADASSFWGRPRKLKDVVFSYSWATFWSYNLGPLIGTHTLSFDIVLTERLITGDGTVYEAGSVGSRTCVIVADL